MEETRSLPIRFGIFEVDPRAGELRRKGYKVKLQEQPFQVLAMLLERPGEIVTRDELQKKLWPADTFVDFERGLNRAINKLRDALADDAANPRFIETLPRRGYRFLGSVETKEAGTPIGHTPSGESVDVGVDAENPIAASRRQLVPWSVAVAMALAALLSFWRPWRSPQVVAEAPLLQLDLELGPDEFSDPEISRDGNRIVFVSHQALAIRRLDQTKTTRLNGTEGAILPFFSPNGQWVGYFAAHKLLKVAVDGGVPIVLCDAISPAGGSWGGDDIIIVALNAAKEGLSRVPASGGIPQVLTDPGEDPRERVMHRWPQVLPGRNAVLFAATNASREGSLRILTPQDGKLRTLVKNSTYGRVLASGYLIYDQGQTLFAAPFDTKRLALTGPPVSLVHSVSTSNDRADFDVSASGSLIYRRSVVQTNQPFWISSSGATEPVFAQAGSYLSPRLSPDGTRLALSVINDGVQSLWVYDLKREIWNRVTSSNETEWLPTWSPDGEFLVFRSGATMAWTRSDGSGSVEHLRDASRNVGPWSFSPDGKWLAFWPLQPDSDLFRVPVERGPNALKLGQPQVLVQQAGSKGAPAISPDGHWMAYSSNSSGRFEVYVMPFPAEGVAGGRRWQVSNNGGHSPIWSQQGRRLFYQSDDRVASAAWTVLRESFQTKKPELWSQDRLATIGFSPTFDVAPDGKRVIALLPSRQVAPETILHVLLNVDSELRRRTPHHT